MPLKKFFTLLAFIPHGHCYLWKPKLVWLHGASDGLIAIAYYSIAITLVYFVRKRQDLPYPWIFLLFGMFIIACGTSHAMEIWTLWYPTYWLSGFVKAITAIVSLYTAIALVPLFPKAMSLPSPAQLEAGNRKLEREISDRIQAEEALRQSEERFRNAFDYAAIGMTLVAPDGRFLKVNRSLREIVGYSEQELLETTFQAITHPDDLDSDLNYARQLLDGEIRSYQMEKRYIHKQEHLVWILLSGSLVRDSLGQPLYFIAQIQDITDRKRMEEALQESERRFHAIFDQTFQFVGLLKPDGTLLEANQTALNFGGFTRKDVVERPFWEAKWWSISQETQNRLQEAIAQAAAGNFVRYEVDVLGAEDTIATIDFSLKPMQDETGKVVMLIPEGRNITEQKQAEKQIQASLKEKEVMLQEIHHRVKNNLQVICSLLNLQSRSIKDKSTLDIFKESQNRVRAMALLHEKLYQSKNLSKIAFAEYARDLVNYLFRSYELQAKLIKLTTNISKDIFLDVDTALPCGLIINELVSNSMKHAFKKDKKGEVRIVFVINNLGELELNVSDNGIGLPENLDLKNPPTLGLKLVNSLIAQLRGDIVANCIQGTEFKIRFAKTI